MYFNLEALTYLNKLLYNRKVAEKLNMLDGKEWVRTTKSVWIDPKDYGEFKSVRQSIDSGILISEAGYVSAKRQAKVESTVEGSSPMTAEGHKQTFTSKAV